MTTTPQAPGITRTDLQRQDLSAPGCEVIQNRVDISPGAPAFRHKHPGEEIIYVLEGSLGVLDRRPASEDVQRRRGAARPGRDGPLVRNTGSANAAELATYFVEKWKPFLVLVE